MHWLRPRTFCHIMASQKPRAAVACGGQTATLKEQPAEETSDKAES